MKATKVKVRTKAIKDGRESIRFDYYPPIPNPVTGKLTRFEYTGLYLYAKPRTPLERNHNKETKALAENIRSQRQLEVQAGQFGFLTAKELTTDFMEYFAVMAAKKEKSNLGNWHSALYHLQQYFGEYKKITDLTATDCEDFRAYLVNAKGKRGPEVISTNTAVSYYGKFKAALKQAYKDGLLLLDLNARATSIKPEETEREFLSLEELQALVNTECTLPILKKAAIFSALTGLRHSDIEKLTWQEVQFNKADGYYIRFRQLKTKGVELLPVPEQAVTLLGDRGAPETRIFEDLVYSTANNQVLREWVKAAGITKHITFHAFRHTYATLQLSLGTDIYTVSKMLGHRELKTTQIYAKVVDKAKREAAGKIKLDF